MYLGFLENSEEGSDDTDSNGKKAKGNDGQAVGLVFNGLI
jgi:hypothetical protein